eukprot:1790613-Amphidinium_carterae.1
MTTQPRIHQAVRVAFCVYLWGGGCQQQEVSRALSIVPNALHIHRVTDVQRVTAIESGVRGCEVDDEVAISRHEV